MFNIRLSTRFRMAGISLILTATFWLWWRDAIGQIPTTTQVLWFELSQAVSRTSDIWIFPILVFLFLSLISSERIVERADNETEHHVPGDDGSMAAGMTIAAVIIVCACLLAVVFLISLFVGGFALWLTAFAVLGLAAILFLGLLFSMTYGIMAGLTHAFAVCLIAAVPYGMAIGAILGLVIVVVFSLSVTTSIFVRGEHCHQDLALH
jgi:hypothetical protein